MKIKFVALVLSVLTFINVNAQTVPDGLALIQTERFNEAGALFKKLAEGTPSATNQYYLGYYYVKNNQLDEAQKAFEKGIQLDEKSGLNQVGLGTVALGKGDRVKSKEYFDAAEKKNKKDAEVLFRIGEAYTLFEKNNDPAEAIRLLDEAVKRDKNLADAYIAKGDALMLRNEGGAAVTAYEYALTAKPNYAAAHNSIGSIYLRGKNYNLALENYKKAIEADPNFAPAYKDLAELYYLAQQYKKAAENFDLFMQKSGSTDPRLTLRAAQFAFVADDYARSLQLLESVKGKLDDNILKRMYGWAYFKTNDADKAIQNLEEFIKVAPDKVIGDDYKYLGRSYNLKATAEGKAYDSTGVTYILKGADLDTNKTEAANTYKEVGALYYGAKDFLNAASAYKRGIELDTAKASANDYYYLGLSKFQTATSMIVPTSKDSTFADSAQIATTKRALFMSADSSFATVTQKLPEWPYGFYWRASTLYNAYDRQENIDKGISAPYYQKLTELAEKEDPTKYKSYLKLAYGYLAFYSQTTKNDPAAAKDYWEKLLKVDPDNASAKEALGLAVAPAAQPAATAKPAPRKK